MSLDDKIAEASALLRREATNFRRPLLAFSGGKDSIVVADLAHRALGVRDAVCDNSWWFVRHQRDAQLVAEQIGLHVQWVDRFGWGYLKTRPKWIFPAYADQQHIWGARHQKTVKSHAALNGYDAIIYGRRAQENNVKSTAYYTADGTLQLHPLRSWKHEDIFAYIEQRGLHLPALYKTDIGEKDGGTPASLISPDQYDRPPEQVVREFCPETYLLMQQHGLFDLYHQRIHGTAQA